MLTKKLMAFIFMIGFIVMGCKDTKKEQEELNQKLEEIEAVETAIDSTLNVVNEKAEQVEELIKELDSI
ncbi:hypothetical protein [uncultured Allomuricauda sp.]|uniref:hypothetical protein n=1 Tax=Flagellimonas sp. W118 TaxID=3410791 RepID=UPI00262FAC41|nr:hypothetical protein [uncultured Allomuricauda sp.]